jgi:ATP-dependent Lon protease
MVAQRDSVAERLETRKELFHIGTVSRILQLLQMPDGGLKALFEGLYRARLVPEGGSGKRYESLKLTSLASLYPFEDITMVSSDSEVLVHSVIESWKTYAHQSRYRQEFAQEIIDRAASFAILAPGILADSVIQFLKMPYQEKQTILETGNGLERLVLAHAALQSMHRSPAIELRGSA